MRWLPWALALAVGCGAAGPGLEVWTRERVELAQNLEAPSYAPDLWSAAQAAAERARRATGDAAADAHSEARLWLEAAIVEAERVKLAQERLAVEREIEGLLASAVKAGRRRRALQAAAEREAAAAAAREEARRALELAATDRRLRPRLSDAQVRDAARTLLVRARLVQAVLVQLSAPWSEVEPVQKRIVQAGALVDPQPERALALADQALFEAHAALGPLRAAVAEPTQGDRLALEDALEAAGASTGREERGLVSSLSGSFRGLSLAPAARRRVERLCSLAQAHPHGPLRLSIGAKTSGQRTRRAAAVSELWSARGCDPERLGTDAEAGPVTGDLAITWVAY